MKDRNYEPVHFPTYKRQYIYIDQNGNEVKADLPFELFEMKENGLRFLREEKVEMEDTK